MLYAKHNGDREHLVGELHQLSNYLMREPEQQQDAATLRRMFNLVADLATALDSIKEIQVAD
ncbi:hypothetical protein [Hymenobacter psychrotolerans]|nr:hypothetical protein [Hymenobacter psychrotolerans]